MFSTTWHSMTEQSSYLLYLSALLYQLQMMICYWVCCCFFPLRAFTDCFKVLYASSKWFIYYSWHLNLVRKSLDITSKLHWDAVCHWSDINDINAIHLDFLSLCYHFYLTPVFASRKRGHIITGCCGGQHSDWQGNIF